MQEITRLNGKMKKFITVIDVYFKFALAIPVHSKDSNAITSAFKQMLTAAHQRYFRRLKTDKGKKLFNTNFKTFIQSHGIQQFASESDQKAAVVKRVNQTIKIRIWTYLSNRRTLRWMDVIHDIVDAYNHTRHYSIGMPPANIQTNNKYSLWVSLYGDNDIHLKVSILQGVLVLASKNKTILNTGYIPKGAKSTLQWVRPCHIEERLSAVYIY